MILAIDIGTITGIAYGGELTGCRFASRDFSNHSHDYALLGLRFSKWIEELILEHKPTSIAIERPYFSPKHATAGVMLHGLCWEAHRIARVHGVPRAEYAPNQIKLFATGHGHAKKEAVIAAIREKGYAVTDSHQADAVALLLLHQSKTTPAS